MDDPRINEAVGAELRAARARLDWSRHELAAHSGVSAISIRRYESGSRSIPVDTLVRLVRSLGIDMYDIERAINTVKSADMVPKGPSGESAREAMAAEARRDKASKIAKRIPRSADAPKGRQD